jgi:hypothetical protein
MVSCATKKLLLTEKMARKRITFDIKNIGPGPKMIWRT